MTMDIHPTAVVSVDAVLGDGVRIGAFTVVGSGVHLGDRTVVGSHCLLGEPPRGSAPGERALHIGERSTIRSHSVLYGGSTLGRGFECGHHVMVREDTVAGERLRLGTQAVLEGSLSIGDFTSIHTGCHVSTDARLGNFVWLFPSVVFTNDPAPPGPVLYGAAVDDFAVVATGTVLFPGVRIGRHAVVGARSVVRRDVPDGQFATGDPAKVMAPARYLRDRDSGGALYPWPRRFERGYPWETIGFDEWERLSQHELIVA